MIFFGLLLLLAGFLDALPQDASEPSPIAGFYKAVGQFQCHLSIQLDHPKIEQDATGSMT
jgi:hypothetical protein